MLPGHQEETFLLRLGVESPDPTAGCAPPPDCSPAGMEPVDVYCVKHERFLPLADALPGRRRLMVLLLLRAALCGAVILTAYLDSAVPVYLAVVMVGTAVAVLPLRGYRVGRWFVTAAWVTCAAGGLAVHYLPARTGRILLTLGLALAVVTAAYLLARVAVRVGLRHAVKAGERTRRGRAHRWSALVAAGAGVAPATFVLYLAVRGQPADWVLAGRSGQRALLALSVAGATSWLLLTAIGGAVLGFAAPVRGPTLPFREPPPPTVLRWAVRTPSWPAPAVGSIERLYRVLTVFLARVGAAGVAMARGLANLGRTALHHVHTAAVRIANWAYRLVVLTVYRIVATLRAMGRITLTAVSTAWSAGVRTARVLVLPVASLAVAAWMSLRLGDAVRVYLVHGPLLALARSGLLIVAISGLLSLCWLALCDLGVRRPLRSLTRTATIAAANVLLLVAVGGWVIGLPGTFGPGPVEVGWVTFGSTGLLILAALGWKVLDLGRRSRPTPHAVSGTPAVPR